MLRQVGLTGAGRFISASIDVVSALRLPSVLAIPFVLDELVPQLQEVVPA